VVVYSFSGLIPIKEASGLLAILSFSSIPRINFSVREQYLRSLFRSREYGFVLVANSLFYMVLAITFAFFFGVMGLALVEYIVPLFGMMNIVYVLKDLKNSNLAWKDIVTKDLRKKIIEYSFVSSATNVLSQLLYLLDVFVLGYMTKNTNTIASYKVATLIPYNLTFIPLSVMVFIYPYFAKYSTDKEWVRTKYKDMLKVMILLNLNISILAIFFSRWIISIFFGAKYLDAVPAFRVLMLGYLVAGTFRIPSGNVLSAIGKLRVNFWNAVISATANILLDVVMIKLYSAIGAAYATVIVYVISSVISTGYLWRYLKKSF
jgi:O-antigen/teichoic acid export membrane protein